MHKNRNAKTQRRKDAKKEISPSLRLCAFASLRFCSYAQRHRYQFLLCLILALKTACMIFTILHAGIGLSPDEAQYWTWSQFLDWGYYSKPPGIAWEIWLGTKLLGNTELGVRAIPLLLGNLIPMLVYFTAWCCRLPSRTCFWASIMIALTPIGIFASLLAITDGGMVFFWTAACACIAYHIERKQQRWLYLWVGLCVLAGALFKWPIYFLWLLLPIISLLTPQVRSYKIFLGIIVSLVALLPTIYWNTIHEWATFRHVGATLAGGHESTKSLIQPLSVLGFLGAQAALVSPILFILLLMAFWTMYRQWHTIPTGVRFCGSIAFLSLTIGTLCSFFIKIQGNWVIFAYPTAFVLLSWYVFEEGKARQRWLAGGLALSVIVSSILLTIPKIQSSGFMGKEISIPYRMNPFRHNVGWDNLKIALEKSGYDLKTDFLLSHTYQTTSILSFYGPEQKRAYFINLTGRRKNQFSFWPGIEQEQQGKKGFFIVVENIPQLTRNLDEMIETYSKEMASYFETVRFVDTYPLFFAYDKMAKGALIFECTNYNGMLPPNTDQY